jgi:hypothetical protein
LYFAKKRDRPGDTGSPNVEQTTNFETVARLAEEPLMQTGLLVAVTNGLDRALVERAGQ